MPELYIPGQIQTLFASTAPLLNLELWVSPLVFVLLGTLVGIIAESIFTSAIRKLLSRTSHELNVQVESLMRGAIRWVFILWGLYAATFNMPFLSAGSLEVLRKMVFLVAMLIAIRLLSQVSVALIRFYLHHTQALQALPNTSIFENLIRMVVFIFGFIMLLQTLGVSVLPLVTALGVGGLAISLALQDTLANMFAGIQMILARQNRVGDFVKLESGPEGFIEDIGWRNTVIRPLSNFLIFVPNSKMSSTIVTNFTLPEPEMSTLIEVSVAYKSNLEHVERVIQEVATDILKKVEGAVPDFTPFIRYHTFGDSGVQLSVILRIQTFKDQYLLKHEFLKALHQRFVEENIEQPFPQRVLHVEPQIQSTALSTQEGASS